MVDSQKGAKKTPTMDNHSASRSGPSRINLTLPLRQSPRNVSRLALGDRASSPKSGARPNSPLASPNGSSPKVIPESPLSPLAQTLSPMSDKLSAFKSSDVKKKSRSSRTVCPCGVSSEGKDWNLVCSSCKQNWHSSCANLKGTNTLKEGQVKAILVHWQCPWCFQCAFSPPDSHVSAKNNQTLLSNTVSCTVLQQISESVTKVVSNSLPAPGLLTNQISELKQQVDDLSKKPGGSVSALAQPEKKVYMVAPEPPFQQYLEDYLEEPVLEETMKFLTEQIEMKRFAQENGHAVLCFGEPYTYVGAKGDNQATVIPPPIASIIESFSTKLKLKHTPNSVLVNHYPATNAEPEIEENCSFLPYHSDDEAVIHPESSIVTVTLGESRSITFKQIHNELQPPQILTPSHNSVYTMSRSSQGWFKHGIEPSESLGERFSLTFRCVDKRNKRNVLIQGDSNTKKIQFGTGAGTVGETYPGTRIKAAKVGDIKPESCIGYSNVVLVCGTNDLRVGYVRDESDIGNIVDLYRTKLNRIRQLAPKCKVFVVPVLPSRNHEMNRNITTFNSMLGDMLSHCFSNVHYPGVYSFLDQKGLLSARLARDNDDIHLGAKGIAQFVRLMKLWIFECEARERRLSRNSSRVPHQRVGQAGPT